MIGSDYRNKCHPYYGKTGKKIIIGSECPNKFPPYHGKTGKKIMIGSEYPKKFHPYHDKRGKKIIFGSGFMFTWVFWARGAWRGRRRRRSGASGPRWRSSRPSSCTTRSATPPPFMQCQIFQREQTKSWYMPFHNHLYFEGFISIQIKVIIS